VIHSKQRAKIEFEIKENVVYLTSSLLLEFMLRFSRPMAIYQKNIRGSLNGNWPEVHREHSKDQREPNRGKTDSQQKQRFLERASSLQNVFD
jgi:hypothetical protein